MKRVQRNISAEISRTFSSKLVPLQPRSRFRTYSSCSSTGRRISSLSYGVAGMVLGFLAAATTLTAKDFEGSKLLSGGNPEIRVDYAAKYADGKTMLKVQPNV